MSGKETRGLERGGLAQAPGRGCGSGLRARTACPGGRATPDNCVWYMCGSVYLWEAEGSEPPGGWSQTRRPGRMVQPFVLRVCGVGVQLSPCRAASRCPAQRLLGKDWKLLDIRAAPPLLTSLTVTSLSTPMTPLAHSSPVSSVVMPTLPFCKISQGEDPSACGTPMLPGERQRRAVRSTDLESERLGFETQLCHLPASYPAPVLSEDELPTPT